MSLDVLFAPVRNTLFIYLTSKDRGARERPEEGGTNLLFTVGSGGFQVCYYIHKQINLPFCESVFFLFVELFTTTKINISENFDIKSTTYISMLVNIMI
jgi:hypothetical protein